MSRNEKPGLSKDRDDFTRKIEADSKRKLKARKNKAPGVWSGLGMMGLIGWSIAVPTLLGAGLGVWLDRTVSTDFSWTLTLIILGLALGCLNAWHWLSREGRDMNQEEEQNDE